MTTNDQLHKRIKELHKRIEEQSSAFLDHAKRSKHSDYWLGGIILSGILLDIILRILL